jgi:hypothetical protein
MKGKLGSVYHQHQRKRTVIATDEAIAVFILELTIYKLFSLFHRYVHVAIKAGKDS